MYVIVYIYIYILFVLIIRFLSVMVWRRSLERTCIRTLNSLRLTSTTKAIFMASKNIGNELALVFMLSECLEWMLQSLS